MGANDEFCNIAKCFGNEARKVFSAAGKCVGKVAETVVDNTIGLLSYVGGAKCFRRKNEEF